MVKQIIGLLIFMCSAVLLAVTPSYDALNSYQFNRKNVMQNNGKKIQTPWFEWWYYKVVLPEKNKSFFFVYGVVNPWDTQESNSATRSYITMGSFSDNEIIEKKFPLSDFSASYTSTDVRVGEGNRATDLFFKGELENALGSRVSWDVSINKLWGFNAASWLTGKNITNIEWYPAQADARCSGKVILNGELETFENAPCYQDRNWGSLFPEWWAWIVSNHFEKSPGTTLAVGGGKPTVFDTYQGLESLAIGLNFNGKAYKWRPHEGDQIHFQIKFGVWEVEAINKKYKIKIVANAARDKFMDLQFVTPQGRIYHDYEALQGDLSIALYERQTLGSQWVLKTKLNSHQAGIEYGSFMDLGSKNNFETMNLCLMGCH